MTSPLPAPRAKRRPRCRHRADVDTTNPNDPAHYRVVTTTTTDAFRFSLQFARRLGPFTGRFGIKESTGGIGLDLHLLSDRFELDQDLFGFGEEIQPRYRVFIAYEFIHRLWLLGGVVKHVEPHQAGEEIVIDRGIQGIEIRLRHSITNFII